MYLEPTKDKEHPENTICKDKYKGLNFAAIFGANASGKTCFFRALTSALILIRTSNNRQVNERLPITPYKFDAKYINQPSKFEIQFVAGDGKKYVYGFSADYKRIHHEYLFRYNSRKPTKIYERNEKDEYEFTAREKNTLLPLTKMNTPNKLFIATATMWNSQSTKAPYEWLSTAIDTYTDLGVLMQDSLQNYQGNSAKEYISFTEKIMKEADINISKINVTIKKTQIDPNLLPLIPGIVINGQLIQPREQTQLEINTFHTVVVDQDKQIEYSLNLNEESQGTQILFAFSPLLKNAFEKGKTIIIDEMDRSLHPMIVKYIINMFRNPEINKTGAQLIITSHDTSLLTLSAFRRDQIYFVEKDPDAAKSKMYSLNDISVRKDENIEKGYLSGRYGSIPNIQVGDII
ncbi:MAG: ATP-binding protein [Eubacterium sp.]|nr:ATP-binding protein [Eubacterium sp.]